MKFTEAFTRVSKVVADHGSEFRDEYARPKNYENTHRNIFGLSVILESNIFEIQGELDVRIVACNF